jgi:cell division protein FtsB
MADANLHWMKRRAKSAAFPAVFLAVTALFGWSTVTGNNGLRAYPEHKELLRQATEDNEAARAERNAWERRVTGLRARKLDPDALDERTRAMLPRAKPDDIIIQYSSKDKLF